mgnify:CR=1 FL=1
MIITRALLTLLLLIVPAHPVLSALLENESLNGHLKTLNTAYEKAPATATSNGFFSANNLRIDLQGDLTNNSSLEFAIDNLLLYSSRPDQVALPASRRDLRLDLDKEWNRGHRWSNRLLIDRLLIRGSRNTFDWSVGRQAIGFGRIVISSPLDIVAPFAPDALDTDVRPGADAIRGVYYFGLGGQIGGTAILGEEKSENSYLLTLTDNRSGVDLLGIGGILRDRDMIGLGLAGNIGTLGVKVEASHYRGKNHGTPGGDLHRRFEIAALELWYRFDNGIILLSQYLYNGAGADDPSDYFAAASAATFQEGLSFLLGQQFLLLGPSWEAHPLVNLMGLLIWNIEDDSALVRPQMQYSLNDNLTLDLFYTLNFGASPETVAPGLSVPKSEFGSVGDSGGLLLRWYF